ncbi:MAG: nicotinate-nucleotide adenylyltransferase [Clostridiaceae bacterium]|nr:nicotinate-nucleotide adenylyltransferase [Clostridiaceae bacterium]
MIGVFGGSFNPVHIGHLILAEYICCEFSMEKIIFVPAKMPPHKTGEELASAQHRFNMVSIAIENNPKFEVSRIELNRQGKSFTVDTLSMLTDLYPRRKICFICGADSLMNFSTWRSTDKIFELAGIIIAGRPDVPMAEFQDMINFYRQEYNAQIACSDSPFIDISSTQIRKRIKEGLSVKYMIPDCVYRYIMNEGLYKGET